MYKFRLSLKIAIICGLGTVILLATIISVPAPWLFDAFLLSVLTFLVADIYVLFKGNIKEEIVALLLLMIILTILAEMFLSIGGP